MKAGKVSVAIAFAVALAGGARTAAAHCDSVDGPVVVAAKQALEKNDANLILVWVAPKDEAEIRAAFKRTQAVRKLGGEAKGLAETYFYETVVRVHRAGEGAPYTGLKPAGVDLGPALPLADKALETGDPRPVWKLLSDATHERLHETFKAAQAAKSWKKDDLAAGRRYVEAYVRWVHFVDGAYQAAGAGAGGHEHADKGGHEHAESHQH